MESTRHGIRLEGGQLAAKYAYASAKPGCPPHKDQGRVALATRQPFALKRAPRQSLRELVCVIINKAHEKYY